MNISDAIDRLQKQKAKHGEIEVYFDCPFCGKSFTPNSLTALAVHLTAELPSPETQTRTK